MNKIGRNDACPCNSGKKFKKCCLVNENAPNDLPHFGPENEFFSQLWEPSKKLHKIAKRYNSQNLLQVLAVLQTCPQNHAKYLRLTFLITEVLNNINHLPKITDFEKLKRELVVKLPHHPFEDPAEDFFTENILFHNGNNVVYPGEFVRATEIVQAQLNSLFLRENSPGNVRRQIAEGVLFLLYIHDSIARELKHDRRLYEEVEKDELYIPSGQELEKRMEYFRFSKSKVREICEELKISTTTIDQFVYDLVSHKTIQFSSGDDHPLYFKPFVLFDGDYILVMPSAELACINSFILDVLNRNDLIVSFTCSALSNEIEEGATIFRGMGWRRLESPSLEEITVSTEVAVGASLFQFDTNKIAYVVNACNIPGIKRNKIEDFAGINKEILNKAENGVLNLIYLGLTISLN